jgi:oxazoline/thiazoline synthase
MPAQPSPDRPSLASHVVLKVVDSADVFLLSEDKSWCWRHPALKELITQLNGRRSIDDLFQQLSGKVSPPEIAYFLDDLRAASLIGDSEPPAIGTDDLAMWHALGVNDATARERIANAQIRLHCLGQRVDRAPVERALCELGMQVTTSDAPHLDVVLADHYYRSELSERNAHSQRTGQPWLISKLIGQSMWIGPLLRPGTTGCLACLQDRLRLNRQLESYLALRMEDESLYETSVAAHPSLSMVAAYRLAQEIALWIAGHTSRLEGKLMSMSWTAQGPEFATHYLTRRPQCPVCGDSQLELQKPLFQFKRSTNAMTVDRGQRVEPSQTTLDRLSRHLSPITGVVTWLVDLIADNEGLLHSYSAGHNFAMGTDSWYWLRQSLRSRTGGKGTTSTQAKVSAIAEAIERYSGVFRGTERRRTDSYELLGDQAIHPHECLNFSDCQYDHRDTLNAANREGFMHLIPRRFPEHLQIDWTPVKSAINGAIRYLPTAYCYYGHPDVERYFYCAGNANGCAAGNVIDEAILHALLEVIERDSATIWWYNRIQRPLIDLDSFQHPYIHRVHDYFARLDRDFWVLDITSDSGIPVFAAVSQRLSGSTQDLLIGLGAHINAGMALERAVTEMIQFLPAVSQRAADGSTRYNWPDDSAIRFWKHETTQSQFQLEPLRGVSARRATHFTTCAHKYLCDNIQTCLDAVHSVGCDVFVLDQSRPDLDLKVARVVVPGFRHFWRRLGPGRLYDIPVTMDWLSTKTQESELNPLSIFW